MNMMTINILIFCRFICSMYIIFILHQADRNRRGQSTIRMKEVIFKQTGSRLVQMQPSGNDPVGFSSSNAYPFQLISSDKCSSNVATSILFSFVY